MTRTIAISKILDNKQYEVNQKKIQELLEDVAIKKLKEYYKRDESIGRLKRLNRILEYRMPKGKFSDVTIDDHNIRFFFLSERIERVRNITRDGVFYNTQNINIHNECILRYDSGFLLIFDLPQLSLFQELIQLVSYTLFGEPNFIVQYRINKEFYRELISYISSEDHNLPGEVLRVILKNVPLNGEYYEEINIKNPMLSEKGKFDFLFENSERILSLTFRAPKMREMETRLTCRLSNEGKLTIYEQELLKSMINGITSLLEYVDDRIKR